MIIETVSISNFRCSGPAPAAISLESAVTAFVGNNGSGKTAVFAALSRMFGTSASQRTIKKSDFHVGADHEQIEDGSTLYVDCVFGFPELENGADADAVPEVFGHMSVAGQGGALKVRIRLEATWTDDGTPEGSIDEELRWIAALDDGFDWSECQKVSAIERNFPVNLRPSQPKRV